MRGFLGQKDVSWVRSNLSSSRRADLGEENGVFGGKFL